MREVIRTQAMRSVRYLGGSAARTVTGALLVPAVALSLTPDEYGRYGLLVTGMALTNAILTLQAPSALGRLYFDHQHESTKEDFLRTTFWLTMVTPLAILPLVAGVLVSLNLHDPITLGAPHTLIIVVLATICTAAFEHQLAVAQVLGRSAAHALASASYGFGLLSFLPLKFVADPFNAVVLAYLIGPCLGMLAFACSGIGLHRLAAPVGGHVRAILRFSLPNVVHIVAMWCLSRSGPMIGMAFYEPAAVAPTFLMVQLTGISSMASRSVFGAVAPEVGAAFAEGRTRDATATCARASGASVALILVGFGLGYGPLYVVELDELSEIAPSELVYVAALVVALLDAIYLWAYAVLSGLYRTGRAATVTAGAGIVSVGCSILLVASFGVDGLLMGMVVGSAVLAGGYCWSALSALQTQGR